MWHRLGIRTLIVYIIRGLLPGVLLILISFFILMLKNFMIGHNDIIVVPESLGNNISMVAGVLTLVAFPVMALGEIIYLWKYFSLKYKFEEDVFKFHKGIVSVDENTIPYLKIENVDFDQSVLGRIIGIAHICILTAGEEEKDKSDADTGAVIKMIDVEKARYIQKELLARGSIQKVKAI